MLAVLAVAIMTLVFPSCSRRSGTSMATPAEFIGSTKCASCHAAQYAAWRTSLHAVAMQEARPGTVLGRFDSTRFAHNAVTSTFYRRADQYLVKTEGADSALHDFQIRYTFGVSPLQQYLVEFPGGRLQPLPIAWDARPDSQNGQRWFSLEPGPRNEHTDEFHWTGREQNWNYMCADCHSTSVRKGYDATRDAFHTSWSEISVACEACHGPGSRHAKWAAYPRLLRRIVWRDDGLPAQLTERRDAAWSIDSVSGNAGRSTPRRTDREIETCAQCHARRLHIADGYSAGVTLLDYYLPLLLSADLYYADGQQHDEVYTYGSFIQSKMYAAGVTCADCHDSHTQRLRRPGNAVCAQCHRAAKYDRSTHHFHRSDGEGGKCVSCHMPATTYMEIDPRHDHSLRIPRPDLSTSLGVPNACNRCHTDRDAQWATTQVRAWYRSPLPGFQRFAGAFAADERADSTAADSLAAVANDSSEPWFVRASALARLGSHPGSATLEAARRWSSDRNPQVRAAVLKSLAAVSPDQRVTVAEPLLGDSTRAVRQEAAWLLAPVADSLSTPEGRRAWARAAAEFVASQRYNADRAPNRLLLGAFYVQRGALDSAVTEFRAAVRLAPHSSTGYLALAELLRAQGDKPGAEGILREGLRALPNDRDLLAGLARVARGSK
jgi:cytochrome c-type biogenesis protein CcmH/NrfG